MRSPLMEFFEMTARDLLWLDPVQGRTELRNAERRLMVGDRSREDLLCLAVEGASTALWALHRLHSLDPERGDRKERLAYLVRVVLHLSADVASYRATAEKRTHQ